MILIHIFFLHYFSWTSSKSRLQISMCSSYMVGRFKQVIKDQISKHIAVALDTESNLTEAAQWEYRVKQAFIIFIPVALRAPS